MVCTVNRRAEKGTSGLGLPDLRSLLLMEFLSSEDCWRGRQEVIEDSFSILSLCVGCITEFHPFS